MSSYYPIFINLKTKKCVVVGGGNVALRKIITLLGHGANVTVISPVIYTDIKKLAADKKITVLLRKYRTGDLRGAFIAVIATNDRVVNNRIVKEACKEKVLLNVVDNPEMSDFIVPSSLNRGDLDIAISTSGKSPAIARKIRVKLESEIGEEYAELVAMIDAIRTEFKNDGSKIDGEDWQKAIDLDELIYLIKWGQGEKAKTILLDNLRKYLNK